MAAPVALRHDLAMPRTGRFVEPGAPTLSELLVDYQGHPPRRIPHARGGTASRRTGNRSPPGAQALILQGNRRRSRKARRGAGAVPSPRQVPHGVRCACARCSLPSRAASRRACGGAPWPGVLHAPGRGRLGARHVPSAASPARTPTAFPPRRPWCAITGRGASQPVRTRDGRARHHAAAHVAVADDGTPTAFLHARDGAPSARPRSTAGIASVHRPRPPRRRPPCGARRRRRLVALGQPRRNFTVTGVFHCAHRARWRRPAPALHARRAVALRHDLARRAAHVDVVQASDSSPSPPRSTRACGGHRVGLVAEQLHGHLVLPGRERNSRRVFSFA